MLHTTFVFNDCIATSKEKKLSLRFIARFMKNKNDAFFLYTAIW